MGHYYKRASHSNTTAASAISQASDVIYFWKHSSRHWFEKNPEFDALFREYFQTLHAEIIARKHDDWMADPYGALALILLTDQYPRNAWRGTVRMYSSDHQAVEYARLALKAGYADMVEERLKLFFFLPFSHSEQIDDQYISVAFTEQLGHPWASQAKHHMEIIRRFGRFPHRNEMLGRPSTQEEMAFLQKR